MTTTTWTQLFLEHWSDNPAPAIVDDHSTVSGTELLQLASGASRELDRLGILPGQPLPALMDESITAIVLTVAGALSGRPLAPLGTKLSATELAELVRALDIPFLVASPERIELAQQVGALTGVKVVVFESFEGSAANFSTASPDAPVLVVHTSGTTGRGRPILMTQGPFGARVITYQKATEAGPGDRFCSASPLYHTAGIAMTLTVLAKGVGVIPMDWFSIDQWRRVGKLGMNYGVLVPTMIDMLLEHGALADAAPRILQYGGAPIHLHTLKEALAALPNTRFVQIFGQTEVSPITYLSHQDHLRALSDRPDLLTTVGRPVSRCELRIGDPDSEGIGEVEVHSPHNFVSEPDGWRRTGDLGAIDDQGYLRLHGRTHDRIIRGGENIYPSEIEEILISHPQVKEVAVVGVKDRRWGETIRAVVVPLDIQHPPQASELQLLVRERLAHFKTPSEIIFMEALPRNANGKILRRELRGATPSQ